MKDEKPVPMTVLVIDDEPDILRFVSRVLELEG